MQLEAHLTHLRVKGREVGHGCSRDAEKHRATERLILQHGQLGGRVKGLVRGRENRDTLGVSASLRLLAVLRHLGPPHVMRAECAGRGLWALHRAIRLHAIMREARGGFVRPFDISATVVHLGQPRRGVNQHHINKRRRMLRAGRSHRTTLTLMLHAPHLAANGHDGETAADASGEGTFLLPVGIKRGKRLCVLEGSGNCELIAHVILDVERLGYQSSLDARRTLIEALRRKLMPGGTAPSFSSM